MDEYRLPSGCPKDRLLDTGATGTMKRDLRTALNISSTLNRLRLPRPTVEHADTVPGCPGPAKLKFANYSIGDEPGLAYHGAVSNFGWMSEHVSSHSCPTGLAHRLGMGPMSSVGLITHYGP